MKKTTLVVIMVLCCTIQSYGIIINHSFEFEHDDIMPNGVSTSVYSYWGMPDAWPWRNSGYTNGHGTSSDWSSDGDWALYVFASDGGNHYVGDYIEFYQSVDLTGMTELLFDVRLLFDGKYTNSYLSIDSQKLWIRNQKGALYDVSVDISSFSGIREIELGVEVFQPFGSGADGLTYFDNIRLIPEPSTILLFTLGAFFLRRKK